MAIVADARLCVCGRRYERRNGYWMVTWDTARPAPEVDLYQAFSNASNSVAAVGTVLTEQMFRDAIQKMYVSNSPQNPFYGVPLLTTNLAPPSAFNYSSVPTSGASVGPACTTCRRDWLRYGDKWNAVPLRDFIADGKTRYRLLGGREFVITDARICHYLHSGTSSERYARVRFVTVAGRLSKSEPMRFSKLSRAVPSNVLWRGSAKDVNKQPVHYELRAEGKEFVIEARRANVYESNTGASRRTLMGGNTARPRVPHGYRDPWQIDATTGTRDTVLACVPDALLESATKAVMKWEHGGT
jgi:hypothetical protein